MTKTIRFDGKKVFADLAVPRLEQTITVAAWIKIESTSSEANYIVSKGEWNQAYSLGLSVAATNALGGTPLLFGGIVYYTPPLDFTGTSYFTCLLSDGQGGSATGTVTMTVLAAQAHKVTPPVLNPVTGYFYQTVRVSNPLANPSRKRRLISPSSFHLLRRREASADAVIGDEEVDQHRGRGGGQSHP